MAITYKILGQSNPSATTNTDVYTVDVERQAVVSTIQICNQNSLAATYRIAIRKAGEAITAKQYLTYDSTVPANDAISLTIGITLMTGDVITVYASSSSLSFNIFGSEIM
jgi:hypothetical protein